MTDDPRGSWSAPWAAVALGVVATIGLAAWAVAAGDPPGRLLVGLAAVAIAAVTAVGAIARPRLAADLEGLRLRSLRGLSWWPWQRVDAVRLVRMRRLGLPGAYVEVDARDDDGTERLLVLGRLELGTDPVDVAADLQEHRARAGRRSGQDRDPGGHEPDEDDGDHGGETETDGGA